MSLKLHNWPSTFALRLNLWYAFVFIASSLVLFGGTYLLLANSIQRKDREVLESRLKEYAAVYQSSGAPGLRTYIARTGDAQQTRSFFVRLVDRYNRVLFLTECHPPPLATPA